MESNHTTQLRNHIRIANIARIKEAERQERQDKLTMNAFSLQSGMYGNAIVLSDLDV